ncbi:glycosyltransferase [Alcaligenaceae bacterium SJ-26]|nr:glycosyltransferase [Alcaligenaceae bacterium SJ-26]
MHAKVKAPFFSVILTTYNRPELLRHTLDSLKGQKFTGFEVIVVNDNGMPVEDVISDYELDVTYLKQGLNMGLSQARNAGLKIARGKYITYIDDDDIYLPEHLEVLHHEFNKKGNALIYTDVVYVQETLDGAVRTEVSRSYPTRHDVFDRDSLLIRNNIPVNSFSHPRDILEKVGYFDPMLPAFEDWDMLLRLSAVLPVFHVKKTTAEVRQRVAASAGDNMLSREEKNFIPLYQEIYARFPTDNLQTMITRRDLMDGMQDHKQRRKNETELYAAWLKRQSPDATRQTILNALVTANGGENQVGVVLLDDIESEPKLRKTLDSIHQQMVLPCHVWILTSRTMDSVPDGCSVIDSLPEGYISGINNLISQADCPAVLLVVRAGTSILPSAVLDISVAYVCAPDTGVWYMDSDVMTDLGTPESPMLLPEINLDFLRSYPYVGQDFVLNAAVARSNGGLNPEMGELSHVDFMLRLLETQGLLGVGHISQVLLHHDETIPVWARSPQVRTLHRKVIENHCQRIGRQAEIVENENGLAFDINYVHDVTPLVSIVIQNRDLGTILKVCIDSLIEKTAYKNYEILIVDQSSTDPETVRFLSEIKALQIEQIKVLDWQGDFSFSGMANHARSQARGDVLLFLDNDTVVTQPDWLDQMLNHALRGEVACVGARLDYPNGRIQHAGLTLGMADSVGFAFKGMSSTAPGYMARIQTTSNISAVSASCMMVRTVVFDEINGFDASEFPVHYGDVDFCLRARQAGYLNVYAARAVVEHLGGASLVQQDKFGVSFHPTYECVDRLYGRWLNILAQDPCYHPAYSLDEPGFSLPSSPMIKAPLPGKPLPVLFAVPGDHYGCGNYRVMLPFQAMRRQFMIDGNLLEPRVPSIIECARAEPDVIVMQGAWSNPHIVKHIQRLKKFIGAKIALEFDDYVQNVPTRHNNRKHYSTNHISKVRRAIEQVDWVVVSTPALAEEYSRFHTDVRVSLNRLEPSWWDTLESRRRAGKKLRVGWAGGNSHAGDLALLKQVVKDTEAEVEWVFFGLKPEGVSAEYHSGTAIEKYPKKLASLNLDLAVVPLEINQFNICKSNLRLLELGVLGIPVICTDIEPYRCGLPVTLVRNRTQDWVAAIREHIAEPQALSAMGDSLREAVLKDWMLDSENSLTQWFSAWTAGK